MSEAEGITSAAPDQSPAAAPLADAAAAASNPPADTAAPADGKATDTGAQQPTPKVERTFTQADIERIVGKERAKAERRALALGYERAKREAAEMELQRRAAPSDNPAGRSTAQDGKPRPEDFGTDWEAYNRAVIQHEIKQGMREAQTAQQRAREQAQAQEQAEAVRAKLAKGSQKYEDFEEIAFREDLRVTETMAETILELGEAGLDVLYFLGSDVNLNEAARIAALPKLQQVREIDKIAAKLAAPPAPTRAPEPIRPNSGGGGQAETLESTAGNYAAWLRVRNKQLGRAA